MTPNSSQRVPYLQFAEHGQSAFPHNPGILQNTFFPRKVDETQERTKEIQSTGLWQEVLAFGEIIRPHSLHLL